MGKGIFVSREWSIFVSTKYKIPGLACRPTILPLGLHAGYANKAKLLHSFYLLYNIDKKIRDIVSLLIVSDISFLGKLSNISGSFLFVFFIGFIQSLLQ